MDAAARSALESIRLNWADTPDDVWGGTADPFHVRGLHEGGTIVEILRSFDDARRSSSGSPIGGSPCAARRGVGQDPPPGSGTPTSP